MASLSPCTSKQRCGVSTVGRPGVIEGGLRCGVSTVGRPGVIEGGLRGTVNNGSPMIVSFLRAPEICRNKLETDTHKDFRINSDCDYAYVYNSHLYIREKGREEKPHVKITPCL